MDNQPFDITRWLEQSANLDTALGAYSLLLRILFFIAFTLYALFSAIVVRQVYLMDHTIKTPLAPVLKLMAWAHLGIAILATLMVFLAL